MDFLYTPVCTLKIPWADTSEPLKEGKGPFFRTRVGKVVKAFSGEKGYTLGPAEVLLSSYRTLQRSHTGLCKG